MRGRPRKGMSGSYVAVPEDAALIGMCGGDRYQGVSFTTDQMRHLKTVYEFDSNHFENSWKPYAEAAYAKAVEEVEKYNATRKSWEYKKELPKKPDHEAAKEFCDAGDNRNLFRHVENDGLRLMAFLSKFLEPGEDPVRLVYNLCADAGYDVPYWEEDAEPEEEVYEEGSGESLT